MDMGVQEYGGGRGPQSLRGKAGPGPAAGGPRLGDTCCLLVWGSPAGTWGCPRDGPRQAVGLCPAAQHSRGSPRAAPGAAVRAALRRFPAPPPLTSAADRRRRGHGELRRRQRQRPRPGPAARPLPMGCGAAGHGAVRGPPSPG